MAMMLAKRSIAVSGVRPATRPALPKRASLVLRAKQTTEEQKSSTNAPASNDDFARFPGDLSRENAEKRADLGSNWTDPAQLQAFDGPAPETINGRLAMLGVPLAFLWEAYTHLPVKQQIADHPISTLAVFIIIAFASYVPIVRGYTRKEELSYGFWTPMRENFNGRLAMIGFAGIVLTETLTGQSTLDFWAHVFHL